LEVSVNAGESVQSVARVRALASTITLVRHQFPAAQANLSPWRDDPQTRQWSEEESLDLSFHFPGWSPRLECRSLLMQLRISAERGDEQLRLLGVLMRGMTYDGERWRLATVGEWLPEGPHLPQQQQVKQLQQICRELFELFDANAASDTAA
jgi:hypothetical protein